MTIYTKRYVNTISLLITIPIYLLLSSLNPFKIKNIQPKSPFLKNDKVVVELNSISINQDTKEKDWEIIIPKISLEAEISEGTRKEVMDKYVGHFEDTASKSGNVGLAAHNRGYAVNYFSDIKRLQEGDEIIYKKEDFKKTYLVSENIIIKDIDWSYLTQSKENKITLITCVENEPEYRRCIQAIDKEEIER